MTMDTEKGTAHCLLCSNKVGSSIRSSLNIFEDKCIANPEKPLVDILSPIVKSQLEKDAVHSSVICKKCCKLVNEADELQTKLTSIKLEICNLYKNTLTKFSKNTLPEEEYNDHDYIESTESIVTERIVESLEKTKVKKKAKKVTILDSPLKLEYEVNTVDDELKSKASNLEPSNEKNYDEQSDDNITNDSIFGENFDVTSPENDSQIEEVAIEKKPPIRKQKVKKEEVYEEVVTKDGDDYVCSLCTDTEKTSLDAKSIIAHLKEEHDVRLYICDICGDQFRKRTDLSHHLDEHVAKEEGDFQCEVCNRIFSNLRLFRIHKRIHYPQNKSWPCDHCGKKYSSKNLLDEHINTHTGNRPYVCEVCNKDFASKYTYRSHVKTHEVRPRPFECTTCTKTFLSQQNLTQHVKTHNGVKEFVCHTCGKAFGSAHNLEVHNIVHTGYKPYICNTCGKAFARKAEIRDHERTHTGEKPYQCELCGATFSQRSNLQSHKRATHFNDKRYKCDDCGKGFKRRRLLDYHIKAAHTGERPFKCSTCSATFVYPEHFKKHMRIHTGEKPYLCEVCGKAFNSRDNRNAHRFIHSDKKPYECLVCGLGFMRKPLLYTHMQAQGHLNDTIVVNQPRISNEEEDEDVIIQGNQVHLVMEGHMDQLDDNAQLIVTDLKDHVIIRNGDQQNVLSLADSNMSSEEIEQLVADGQMTFEEDGELECKTESDGVEEVYGYQDAQGNTIVLPPGTDINDLLVDGNKSMRLVQIRIPSDAVATDKNWLSLVQN